MLRFLGVRHLAVIDHLEMEFRPGLNLITGETGAGKSVLIEAIDLLLGGRATSDLVRTGESSATVQAIFDRDDQAEILVRREVSALGRSRAFIDDSLVTTTALRELGQTLVDLHGQHEHQTLLEPSGHLQLLDAFMAEPSRLEAVVSAHLRWRTVATELGRTRLDAREKRGRIELASFHLSEIDKIAPAAGEDEALGAERQVLANADRLRRLSEHAYAALYEGEQSALSTLATVWKRLMELASLDARFAPYGEQREAIKSNLEDLAFFLRSYHAHLDASPDRLQFVEDRLAAIERLKKKYGPTLPDVLARHEALRQELAGLEASEERAAVLDGEEQSARAEFLLAARALSAARLGAGGRLARALEATLSELAMPSVRVDVRVSASDSSEDWGPHGLDGVEFFLSPNPGEELRPLARIASGGELSRVMLALHTLAATGAPGRTLVFDEVDAGIGGAAADAVGARLQHLARRCQVICITHLPQIAARGGAHFQISKAVTLGRTSSVVTRLDVAARELEIGRMIAGTNLSAEVLASARELLRSRGESEYQTKDESPVRAKAKGRTRGA